MFQRAPKVKEIEKAKLTERLMNIFSKLMILSLIVFAGSTPLFAEGLTLEQAMREACTRSDSAKMMHESIKKSKAMVREKWSNALPVISATATTARNRGSALGGGSSTSATRSMGAESYGPDIRAITDSIFSSTPPADSIYEKKSDLPRDIGKTLSTMFSSLSEPQYSTIYSVGVSVNQPLFTFGKIGTAIDVANHFNESAVCSFKRNMQTLQLQAVDAYYRALLAQMAADISARSLARKTDLNQFLARNFNLGSGNKAQVLATKADALSQSSATLIAKRDAQTARMYLNSLVGRPLTDSTVFDTTGIPGALVTSQLPNATAAIEMARDSRNDIKAIALLAKSTRGGAKIFKAMYYPSIGLMGSLGYSKLESGSIFASNSGMMNWTVGVGASWTFFDGFANSSRAAQYASDAEKLELAGHTVTQMVEIEIRSAIAEWTAADSNFDASREMVNASRESYNLTNNNFKQGSGQLIDLQRADEQLLQAELGLANARYRVVRSRAALLVAMGKDIITVEE
jgi:outer membrane protein